jgi:hypothetical protein
MPEEEEEEYEDTKPSANAHQPPSNRLQEFIRLANFHILQLARPECISIKTKNEKRKTKNEKRKTKNEKRKTKNEKRKTKNEN